MAEGGAGGTTSVTSAEDCEQVPPPIGPYTAGPASAGIRRMSPDDGRDAVIVAGFPSSQTSARSGGMVSGVAAVAFLGRTLYALTSGAGCSHGLKGTANGIVRICDDGIHTQIADLSAFWKDHPPAHADPEDIEPDGTPFGMVAHDGRLYVIEAHNAVLDEITTDGRITRLVDISASEGHVVPTSVVFHEGRFFVGSLHRFPVRAGAARIYEITREGKLTVLAPKLTAVTAIAFDVSGRLYALETTTVDNSGPAPGSGRVVRVLPDSETPETVASGLTFPTAMTFGPDGVLYVSNFGFGFPPGSGQIVRVEVPDPP